MRAGFNKPAITALWCRGIERAPHRGRAGGHAAQQNNLAVLLLHRPRLNHTGVVDHTGQQTVTRTGAEQHLPAIGLNQPAVLRQGVDLIAGDLQAQQLAACKVQAHRAARAQRHRATGGADIALVGHAVAQERHVPALRGVDAA